MDINALPSFYFEVGSQNQSSWRLSWLRIEAVDLNCCIIFNIRVPNSRVAGVPALSTSVKLYKQVNLLRAAYLVMKCLLHKCKKNQCWPSHFWTCSATRNHERVIRLLFAIMWTCSQDAFLVYSRPVFLFLLSYPQVLSVWLLLPAFCLIALPPCLPLFYRSTHFTFRRPRIRTAPLREVCENGQCRSPGVPTPGTECEKRALHLMPDWPNLLPDSWAFLFPVALWEQGQKWCGRRGEGTVIVSRSVEIPHPPTAGPPFSPPKPPLNCFSVKRKRVPG